MTKKRIEPDLVALNGNIVTMDPGLSTIEAIAISNGRITALGSSSDLKSMVGPGTKVVDLEGKTALPGFIDAHHHLQIASSTLGLMAQCHTPPNDTIEDVIQRLNEWKTKIPSEEWIIGQGCLLQDLKLKEGRFPNRYELDKVSIDRPVLFRPGMHITVLNSKAIEILGITGNTEPPQGAVIDLDPSSNEPTGITRDFWHHIPFSEPDENRMLKVVESYIPDFCLSNGVTSIHDLPETTQVLKIYQKLIRGDRLPLRIRFYYRIPDMIAMDEVVASGLSREFGNDFLRLGGVKIFIDGGFSSAGGVFHEPYAFDKTKYGVLTTDQASLNHYLIQAKKAGLQVVMHAAGDKAADMGLDAVENAGDDFFTQDHRTRIEHMGNVYPQKHRFDRAKRLGVLPAPNMGFIFSFGDQVEYLLGRERAETGFWCRSLLEDGFKVPGTSDATGTHPENSNPFFCIARAIDRKTFSGKVLSPEEKITMTDAVRMYTNHAAWAGFEEHEKGSLEVGKLGDMIVLSQDPWSADEAEIENIKVLATILGGKIVYNPGGF
jgi:predicted amidohydrolase YtcJ